VEAEAVEAIGVEAEAVDEIASSTSLIQAFDNVSAGKRKTRSLLDFFK